MSYAVNIDAELISYLEDLSCLTLTDSEKERLTADLKEIMSGMARLGELETAAIPELSHPFDNVNAFREDVPKPSFPRDSILRNAPESNGEMIIAPMFCGADTIIPNS